MQTVDFTHETRSVPDLSCPKARPPVAPASAPRADIATGASRPAPRAVMPPTEIPAPEDVQAALNAPGQSLPAGPAPAASRLNPAQAGWHIAVWGDSHMAAGFFTDELARRLALAPAAVSTGFLSAGIGHAGVRQAVRAHCLGGSWGREHAHASNDAAQSPGPGLTTLVARQPGATLALDLRDAQGQPVLRQVQVLHDGADHGPLVVAVSVDGEPEVHLALAPSRGASRLVVRSGQPMSTLSLRVIQGAWRLQGLRLVPTEGMPTDQALTLDQFGFPGATVAGWARADLNYLAQWFGGVRYDLVVMAFGTNEANDPQFNETSYRDLLTRAVSRWRQLQPQAQCVLIAPGDRGVRVMRQARRSAGKTASADKGHRSRAASPAPDLLRYSRLHARIAQIQAEVAGAAGCAAWSMQSAMGGPASAYAWARHQPAWMAPDLIHLTRAGYRELAAAFVAQTGLAR